MPDLPQPALHAPKEAQKVFWRVEFKVFWRVEFRVFSRVEFRVLGVCF